MVEKPPILWLPAHPQNVLARPAGLLWEGLVAHTTAGGTTIAQLGAWFGGLNIQQGLRGSTHFGVDRDGVIGQFVNLDNSAIAHGQDPGSTAFLVRENPGLSMNHVAIGIEHLDAGVPGSVTQKQLDASAWLMAWLWQEYIAPNAHITAATLDLNHLVQHKDFAPVSKPLCASWTPARMQEHLARTQTLLSPPQPVPPPVTDWEAQYRSLETKYAQLDREAEQWTVDDEIGAQLRRARLAELRTWTP